MTTNVRHNLCWVVAHHLTFIRRVYVFASNRKESSNMYFNLYGNFPGLRSHHLLVVAVALCVTGPLLVISLLASTPQLQSTLTQSGDVGLVKLPLSFEPNWGQTNEQVRYLVHARGGTFFFTPSEVALSLAMAEQEAYKTITDLETDVAPKAINGH